MPIAVVGIAAAAAAALAAATTGVLAGDDRGEPKMRREDVAPRRPHAAVHARGRGRLRRLANALQTVAAAAVVRAPPPVADVSSLASRGRDEGHVRGVAAPQDSSALERSPNASPLAAAFMPVHAPR